VQEDNARLRAQQDHQGRGRSRGNAWCDQWFLERRDKDGFHAIKDEEFTTISDLDMVELRMSRRLGGPPATQVVQQRSVYGRPEHGEEITTGMTRGVRDERESAQTGHAEDAQGEVASRGNPALAHLARDAQAKVESALAKVRFKRTRLEELHRETINALSARKDKLLTDITHLHRLLDLTASSIALKVARSSSSRSS